ncbi:DUF4142 domain-containing protein [Deinococcus sp. VB343]|uniref:DUF4142 domain-containing protein n=1 Tax=Deinococcus sp. VB142 TaxID=3112952 RepID=A0AAU6Q2X2_9DEIO
MTLPKWLLATPLLVLTACTQPATQAPLPTEPVAPPAVQCGLSAAAITVNPVVTTTDTCFAQQAAMSDLFEIRSSELALSRSSNDAVKRFAQTIISDHKEASGKLKTRAGALNITLPTDVDAPKLADLQALQVKKGEAFDRAYAAIQVNAHVDAVNLFTNYAAKGQNPDLKAHATETLLHLKHHLEMARELLSAVK